MRVRKRIPTSRVSRIPRWSSASRSGSPTPIRTPTRNRSAPRRACTRRLRTSTSSSSAGAGPSSGRPARATASSSRRQSASDWPRWLWRRARVSGMPFYQRLGNVPRKRHIQFRDNGALLTEEGMGMEGFVGMESILYHLQSPCRVMKVGDFEEIEREEWVPDAHAHRHFKTYGIDTDGDEITGRRLLMWNNDVEISLCRPKEQMDYFFRNGEGDEVIFVHEGTGTLETSFGDVPSKEGAYVVAPRGPTYRFRPEGDQRYLVFETPGLSEIPRRYRNQHG